MRRTLLSLLLSASALGACRSGTVLVPGPGVPTAPESPLRALADAEGVQMTVRAGAWPGGLPITRKVTPVQVTIRNESGRALAIRHGIFSLAAPDGRVFSPVPPVKISGSVPAPLIEGGPGPIHDPGFHSDNFYLAPYYSALYPGVSVYRDPFYFDGPYFGTYYDYWDQVELPTREMVQRALPEGVVEKGGRLDGFLYFERVPADLPKVVYTADLVDARTGRRFGRITIPFAVVEQAPAE